MRGKRASEETKLKQSVAKKGMRRIYREDGTYYMGYSDEPKKPRYVKKGLTKSSIEERTKKLRGQVRSLEQKITISRSHMKGKILCCSNGKEYFSSFEASLDTGAVQAHIGSICNGKRKSSNGLSFWYKG